MKTKIELEIPEDVIRHAKDSGISLTEFKKSLSIFGTMQLTSETSRLNSRGADMISESIKASSWKKISKSLNL